ncbi:flagellar protein fliJ [Clostridium putrefaciens]|uniref:Flagellar FliJ protein n=1 Tax=Clostridium putrefaciens TaxID=99675 RepID=A0A381JAS8_9CLOT|nr:flagellar export protein FliJ [Clostridium putrefaciens]SUY47482.1 flagellar protein fliJ [Clostridium putrefaciens]
MTAFNFRLQKLLDIRTEKEEESKKHFSEAQSQKDKTEDLLNVMKQNYSKYNNVLNVGSVIEQKIKRNYLNELNTSIDEKVLELDKRIIILEDKRRDLKTKQVDRKTVEILRQKREVEFLDLEKHMEQTQNDEFALYGYMRNRERR